jgi:glutamate formiminotransferase
LAGVAERLATPEGAPDLGPARLHPTLGATVIGARRPLVAYNMVLATDDMAVWLASRSRVQISVNLTDPTAIGFLPVFKAVEEAAAEAGVTIESSELIGLSPMSALIEVALDRLKLNGFGAGQVLESHFIGKQLSGE